MTLGKILKLFVSINEHAFIVAENFLCTVKTLQFILRCKLQSDPAFQAVFVRVTRITAPVPVGSALAFPPRTKATVKPLTTTVKPLNTAECCQNILALPHMCFTNTFCCSMFRNLALLSIFVAISTSSYCIWDYDLRVKSCWFNIYFSHFERTRNRRAGYHPVHFW